jgi:hypothetical protein
MKIILLVTCLNKVSTTCSPHAYDITLVAEISSHCVPHTVSTKSVKSIFPLHTHEKRNKLVCFSLVYIFFFPLFLSIKKNVKEMKPYCISTLPFDKLLTSYRHFISGFVYSVIISYPMGINCSHAPV